jgi:hypothetical protein
VTVSTRFARASAVLALALGLAACAKPQAKNPFAAPGTGRGEGSIRVRIENQNFGDATIHAIRGGERIRLGQVTGKSEKDFTMRWTFSLPLEFEVHIIGGQGCGVRPLSVDPGDRVWVRIPTQIGASPCYAGKT